MNHQSCLSGKRCVIALKGMPAVLGPWSRPYCLPCTRMLEAKRLANKKGT